MTAPALPRRFDAKVALVTGAGSGIGRASALRLVAEGATVVGVDVSEAGLAESQRLAGGGPGRLEAHVADVSDRAACVEAVESTVRDHGRLDVLGNVAGILDMNHVTEVTEQRYRQLMGVNIDGPFFLCQAAIPHLLETSGNIVNMASNSGLMGTAYTAVYCMTKGALVQLTRALAMEFLKRPLRVNAIAPGGTTTALTNHLHFPEGIDMELVARYMVPRPMADPEDIAAVFAFIASDEARTVHGAIVSSDNGLTAG